jgi:hypothetical protein
MKKIFILTLTVIATAIFFTSCKKEKTDEITNITLNVTVNAGETYKLDLSKYGDADDAAKITKQATNFAASEIVKNATIGEYNFMKAGNPKVGGNGNETVVLKVSEGIGGGNGIATGGCIPNSNSGEHYGNKHNGDETNITINFTVL